jgi:SAM-dependent methyltransferase
MVDKPHVEVLKYESLPLVYANYIKQQADNGCSSVAILEAGCGRQWAINLDGLEHTLTGIDLDRRALNGRIDEVKDLDIAIHGDLRDTTIVPAGSYDVIYSAFVLEHVQGAEAALSNFARWLAPGGIMLLRFPEPQSVYGWIVRHTPFRLHVWYHRYLLHLPNAGRPGHPPYPTVYNRVLFRNEFHNFCAANNLDIEEEHGTNVFTHHRGILWGVIWAGFRILEIGSLGSLTSKYNDISYVIRG